MCGIVGIHGQQETKWLESLTGAIVHRGPDDAGHFRDPDQHIGLGMRRLAIIDIADGQQPMTTADGRFTIVFNGEIYNAPQLREELGGLGASFRTDHSDTEVLLEMFARHGERTLRYLNGMFVFAVFDREEQRLFLARDRLGIKPLYYADIAGRFVFASELKALLTLPFVSRDLDRQSLFDYMSLMYVPGERTIVDGVRRLPAGHSLNYCLRTRRIERTRWWQPMYCESTGWSRQEWTVRLREKLEESVQRWSISDVPVGCSLSGGLDSSAIVALLARTGKEVRTYSLGFTRQGEQDWNELPLARKVAQKWGTTHQELVLDPESLLDDLLSMVWHLDEPYGGGLPSWTVFNFMSRDVKVGMTGTGGDELFGGYGKWRPLEGGWLRRTFSPSINRETFRRKFFERFYYLPDTTKRDAVLHDSFRNTTDTSDGLYHHFQQASPGDLLNRVSYIDLATQLPEEFLMMTDRFSMAHSLEARTPFLDHEFVELALSVPSDVRTRRGDLKGLLRDTVHDLLPVELLSAPKKGFVIPLRLWLRDQLRPLVDRLLGARQLRKHEIFKPDFYEAFVKPHMEGRADHTNVVWAALMYQLWQHLFIETQTRVRPAYDWKALLE